MTRLKGYGGRVLRVDLTHSTYRAEELDESLARAFLGGRGLNVYRLYWEVPPGVNPLGPENKLMIATGPMVGFPHGLGSRLTAPRPLGRGVLRPLGLPLTFQAPLTGAASQLQAPPSAPGRRGLMAC